MPDGPTSRGATVLGFLDGLSRWAAWLTITTSIVLVLVADLVTSAEVEVGALYLFPIFLATWRLGRLRGLLTAAFCALLWLSVDMVERVYALRSHEIWNAVFQFGTFLTFSMVSFALRTALEHQKELALTDPLTGAANRRAFEARAELELARSQRTGAPVTLALLDLDDFKEVNDRLGHAAGDRLLKDLVAAIGPELRATDLLVRLGGDEFAILLTETAYDDAAAALEKVRSVLGDRLANWRPAMTISIGAVTHERPPASVAAMLEKSDGVLYHAKHAGKSQTIHVRSSDPGVPPA